MLLVFLTYIILPLIILIGGILISNDRVVFFGIGSSFTVMTMIILSLLFKIK